MKTAVLFFRSVEQDFDGEYYGRTISAFKNGGIEISTVEILSRTDDFSFRRRFDEFKDTFDNLVIIGGEGLSFNLKEIIAEKLETALLENENARIFLKFTVPSLLAAVEMLSRTHKTFPQKCLIFSALRL